MFVFTLWWHVKVLISYVCRHVELSCNFYAINSLFKWLLHSGTRSKKSRWITFVWLVVACLTSVLLCVRSSHLTNFSLLGSSPLRPPDILKDVSLPKMHSEERESRSCKWGYTVVSFVGSLFSIYDIWRWRETYSCSSDAVVERCTHLTYFGFLNDSFCYVPVAFPPLSLCLTPLLLSGRD